MTKTLPKPRRRGLKVPAELTTGPEKVAELSDWWDEHGDDVALGKPDPALEAEITRRAAQVSKSSR